MAFKTCNPWKQCILSWLNKRCHYLNSILYNTNVQLIRLEENTIGYETNEWHLLLSIRSEKVSIFFYWQTNGGYWWWWVDDPLSRSMALAFSNWWTPSYDSVKICTTIERSNEHDYSITKGFSYKIILHRVSLNSIFPSWI